MPTWDKEKMRIWMRERRKQRKAQGLCIVCGSRPAVANLTRCEYCRKYQNNYKKTVDKVLDTTPDI